MVKSLYRFLCFQIEQDLCLSSGGENFEDNLIIDDDKFENTLIYDDDKFENTLIYDDNYNLDLYPYFIESNGRIKHFIFQCLFNGDEL